MSLFDFSVWVKLYIKNLQIKISIDRKKLNLQTLYEEFHAICRIFPRTRQIKDRNAPKAMKLY